MSDDRLRAEEPYGKALGIVAEFLTELTGDVPRTSNHWAAALIARLAKHDPPILLAYPEELKDGTT